VYPEVPILEQRRGENPTGAANQQERLMQVIRILRDYTPDTELPSVKI
jgi:hypothetical protein